MRIQNPKLRRRIVELVEEMAGEDAVRLLALVAFSAANWRPAPIKASFRRKMLREAAIQPTS